MKTRIRYLLLLLTFSSYIGATDYTITVASNMCDDTKEYTIAENNSIVLHAHPDAGYVFTKWSDGNTDNPRIVKVTENAIYKAEYTAMSPMPTTHTITVCAEDCENPTVKEMVEGEVLTIYPYPSPGYAFSKWSDGNTDNPRVVTITGDATYKALFTTSSAPNPEGEYTFTVNAEHCATSLSRNFAQGTEVKLYAHSDDACFSFAQWSDGNTDNPRTVTVTENKEYTAIFEEATYSINVTTNDDLRGKVSITQPTIPYVGFTATADNSSIRMVYGGTLVGCIPNLQYSYDGQSWKKLEEGTKYNVEKGQTIYMRGHNPDGVSRRFDGYSYFDMKGSFEGSGDLMTLVDSTGATTTAPDYCFYRLFRNCTSLIKAPRLTATTVNYQAYVSMFSGCTNLQHIEVDFTAWSSSATESWVSSVAPTGTFVKPTALSASYGSSNIPSGWTVLDKETNDSSTSDVTSGTYECETTLILTATPNDCYQFIKWSDGNTDNPRTVTVTENKEYTAIFNVIKYTVTTESVDETQGTTSVTPL